jgi:tetratricopeptide (TPR) repeat protein
MLIDQAKMLAPRCLTTDQRQRYHLSPEPPHWCDSTQKWPYDIVTVGQDYVRAERWRDAITAFNIAIARDPKVSAGLAPRLAAIHNRIAWDAFQQVALRGTAAEQLIEALDDAEKGVALAPGDNAILDTRGQIYLALARIDEALADFDKAIARGYNRPGTFYGRGRCYELKGNRDAATADYLKAVELLGKMTAPGDYQRFVDTIVRERLATIGVAAPAAR